MSMDNRKRFKNTQQYANSYVHKFSRTFYEAILVSELYRLPKCITPHMHSLSLLKNNLCDAFINARKINVLQTR